MPKEYFRKGLKRFNKQEKIGTAVIVIDRLSGGTQAFGVPRVLRPGAIGFPHHPTQRENYQERVSEDKDGLRQRLGVSWRLQWKKLLEEMGISFHK